MRIRVGGKAVKSLRRSGLVVFSGIDGAGKSTIVRSLAAEMRARGFDVHDAWCGFADWKVLALLFRPLRAWFGGTTKSYKPVDVRNEVIDRALGNRFVRFLYYSVVSFDYFAQVLVNANFARVNGKVVLCDRYYFDQAISYGTELDSRWVETFFLRLYSAILPTPLIVFIVLVPPRVAMERKSDILSETYVESRYRRYRAFAERPGFVLVDGERPIAENVSVALQTITRVFYGQEEERRGMAVGLR